MTKAPQDVAPDPGSPWKGQTAQTTVNDLAKKTELERQEHEFEKLLIEKE